MNLRLGLAVAAWAGLAISWGAGASASALDVMNGSVGVTAVSLTPGARTFTMMALGFLGLGLTAFNRVGKSAETIFRFSKLAVARNSGRLTDGAVGSRPIGVIALLADDFRQRTANLSGLFETPDDAFEIPLRPPAEFVCGQAHCRTRGRCSETSATLAGRSPLPSAIARSRRTAGASRRKRARSSRRNGVVALTMYLPKPIVGARSTARRCASTTSSIATRRNRNSFAFMLSSSKSARACPSSSPSGKKRDVLKTRQGRPSLRHARRQRSSAAVLVTP